MEKNVKKILYYMYDFIPSCPNILQISAASVVSSACC